MKSFAYPLSGWLFCTSPPYCPKPEVPLHASRSTAPVQTQDLPDPRDLKPNCLFGKRPPHPERQRPENNSLGHIGVDERSAGGAGAVLDLRMPSWSCYAHANPSRNSKWHCKVPESSSHLPCYCFIIFICKRGKYIFIFICKWCIGHLHA